MRCVKKTESRGATSQRISRPKEKVKRRSQPHEKKKSFGRYQKRSSNKSLRLVKKKRLKGGGKAKQKVALSQWATSAPTRGAASDGKRKGRRKTGDFVNVQCIQRRKIKKKRGAAFGG